MSDALNWYQEILLYVCVVGVVMAWLVIKAVDENDIWPTGTA